MTAIPPSDEDPDCADFVSDVLDWLESDDLDPDVVDTVFDVLADERRRCALEVVRTVDDDLTLPDLADAVAEREVGDPIVDIPPERVSRVYLSLYHDHLPRLVEAGLLEYHQERDLVVPKEL